MKCGAIFSDERIEKIKSCENCGGKFFLYGKTIEELTIKEEPTTKEEQIFGVSGEIEVKRIGDNVIIRKVGVEKEEKISEKEKEREEIGEIKKGKREEKGKDKIIEKESISIPYLWNDEEYRKIISTQKEPPFVKTLTETKSTIPEHEKLGKSFTSSSEDEKYQKPSGGLISLKKEGTAKTDLEWLEAMYGGQVEGVVSLDVETLKILRSGKYEIDIAGLMSYKPLILSPREGTFYIDLQSAMTASLEKKKKRKGEEI